MFASSYLDCDMGMTGVSLAILWCIVQYFILLSRRGYDWIVCGDFQMSWQELNGNRWVTSVTGHPFASSLPSRVKTLPGTHIDLMLACSNLLPS